MNKYDVLIQLKQLLKNFEEIKEMKSSNFKNHIRFDKLFPTNQRKEYTNLDKMLNDCSNKIWNEFDKLLKDNFGEELVEKTLEKYSIVDNEWLDILYKLYLEEGNKR